MVRERVTDLLFAAGLLCLPFSYALKGLLSIENLIWVDPTLMLGLGAFVLSGFRRRDLLSWSLVGYVSMAALFGFFLAQPGIDREKSQLNIATVEVFRFTLNIIWFLVCAHYSQHRPRLLLRWTCISVVAQFALSIYLYLAMIDLAPIAAPAKLYLDIYKTRQVVWFGDWEVYRVAGTFDESPPYGLFMLCCFVVFSTALASRSVEGGLRRWALVGAVISGLGAVASLSDQILLAMIILVGTILVKRLSSSDSSRSSRVFAQITKVVIVSFVIVGVFYIGQRLLLKSGQVASADASTVYGSSGGERYFHLKYGLGIFLENPASLIMGIGPGRYGDCVSRTGLFPNTVTLQTTPIEWLVEYGILGSILIWGWLLRIARRASESMSTVGIIAFVSLLIANTFQANWKWESWFLALAFLYIPRKAIRESADTQHFVRVQGAA